LGRFCRHRAVGLPIQQLLKLTRNLIEQSRELRHRAIYCAARPKCPAQQIGQHFIARLQSARDCGTENGRSAAQLRFLFLFSL
jgi:hypothetical protein